MNLKEGGAKRAAIPEKEVLPEEGVVFLIVLAKSVTCRSDLCGERGRHEKEDGKRQRVRAGVIIAAVGVDG
jgi:hypothetical protein